MTIMVDVTEEGHSAAVSERLIKTRRSIREQMRLYATEVQHGEN